MKNVFLFLMLTAGAMGADNSPALPDLRIPVTPDLRAVQSSEQLWRVSLVSVAVAQAMDSHSSWGKRELNPVLANEAGAFGTKGALIKLTITSSLMGIEYLVTRGQRNQRLYRTLSVINFGAAGASAAVATRNYGIPRR